MGFRGRTGSASIGRMKTGWDQRMSQGLLDDLLARVREQAAADLTEFHALLDEIRADGSEPGLASLAVAVRALRALSRQRTFSLTI